MVIEQMCISDVIEMQTTTQQIQDAIIGRDVHELDRLRLIIRADRTTLKAKLDAMPESDRSKDFNRCVVECLYDASVSLSTAVAMASEVMMDAGSVGG